MLKCAGAYEGHKCFQPVTHAEHWYEHIRAWCEEHTPWSGHYEHHMGFYKVCENLLRKLRGYVCPYCKDAFGTICEVCTGGNKL